VYTLHLFLPQAKNLVALWYHRWDWQQEARGQNGFALTNNSCLPGVQLYQRVWPFGRFDLIIREFVEEGDMKKKLEF